MKQTILIRKLLCLFTVILALNFSFIFFFSNWNFTKPIFYNTFWALHFCSIISIIILSIMFARKKIGIGLPIILFLSWVIIFIGQFNPIDTYEYPHDKKVIVKINDEKIVIRESKSAKTHEIELDTVKVLDKFIFRKIIE